MPHFSFFTSHSGEPVTPDSPVWQQPIPLRLDALFKMDDASVSHADYFQAAQTFLEAHSYAVITRAASQRLGRKVKPQDIAEIRVRLEKHGAYYHPARVETSVGQKQLSFVLNVAISASGRRLVEKEYQHLKRLNAETLFSYLPQVYGWERISGSAGMNFGMFLGQWFDGYHEFHLALDPADQKLKISVWDDTRGRFFLTAAQTKTLYAQAAKILTAYYNLVSFEQISSWHHAAGDFIVNLENKRLRLRLITVRRYAMFFENRPNAPTGAKDPQQLMQALLVFLLDLSIRNRLDRLDGVGQMVWSDEAAVDAALIGFLEALSTKPAVATLPDSPLACFIAYLAACKASDLLDLSTAIVNRFNPRMPELPLIKKNLNQHVETIYESIQDLLSISTT